HVVHQPIAVPQGNFFGDRDYGDVARTGTIRIGADFQRNLLTGRIQEETVEVVAAVEIAAVHGEKIFAGLYLGAGFGERCAKAGIPVFAAVDFGEAVAAIFRGVIGA